MENQKKIVDELFKVYDVNSDQKLNKKEARRLIKDFLNHFNKKNETPKTIDDIMNLMDVDNDDHLSKEELHHLLQSIN